MTRLGPYPDSRRPSRQSTLGDVEQLRNSRIKNRLVFGAKKSGQDEVLVLVGDVEGAIVYPAMKDVSVDGRAPRV